MAHTDEADADTRPASCATQLRILANLITDAKKINRAAFSNVLTQIADQVQQDETDLENSHRILQRVGLLTHLFVDPTDSHSVQ